MRRRGRAEAGAVAGPLITRDQAIAHHEAAHLVAATALGLSFVEAGNDGERQVGHTGAIQLAPDQLLNEDVAVVCLAGLASSEILLGSQIQEIAPEQLLARRDVVHATALIERLAEGDEKRAESLFVELVERAEGLLQAHSGLWQRLTIALVAQSTLNRAEILRLANEERGRR